MNFFDILLIPIIIIYILLTTYIFLIALAPVIGIMTVFLIPLTGMLICGPISLIVFYKYKDELGEVNIKKL
jgi:hypothetical protein